ncbi:MAG: hypothetical protein GTN70_06635, partial [Deltaproteobacteria bacterium]|nr:hypothetical protein [Deltaproteobacteria bacterium]
LFLVLVALLGLSVSGFVPGEVSVADSVPRMAKEELKELIGSSDVVVLDVRTDFDWVSDKFKIKGAVREHPGDFETWSEKYPKEKTIVLYCA